MDRFTLEGTTYFQQGRKCGRASCKCQTGELHGPYWYARDHIGRVTYIGKDLPANVQKARANYDNLRGAMYHTREHLRQALAALIRLMDGEPLQDTDRVTLCALGFEEVLLVLPGGQPATQAAAQNIGLLVDTLLAADSKPWWMV